MKIMYLSDLHVSGCCGTNAIAAAKARPGVASGTSLPRITPPFAFEVEEFHSRLPEENWRHRLGVPQELDFPSTRVW